MNILAQGGRPFRLDRRIEELPYPAGDVEFLDDDYEDEDSDVLETARERYANLVEHVTDERPSEDQLAELGAYGMAATIELSPAPKQALLEERSEAARLRVVSELFELARRQLEQADEFEYVIENDELDRAVEELTRLVTGLLGGRPGEPVAVPRIAR